jgi:hypothetical protein
VIHLLLINLMPEAEWMAWRAAKCVWGGRVSFQSAPDIETALAILRHAAPFEQAPCPSLVFLATGAHGDWNAVKLQELRRMLAPCEVPLVGLADTSRAMEHLRARHAPLDAVLLSPVQPDALYELAETLNLDPPIRVTALRCHAN